MSTEADLDRRVAETIERDGFTVVPEAMGPEVVSELEGAISAIRGGEGVYDRGGIYAIRNLLGLAPEVKKAIEIPAVRSILDAVLGPEAILVRGLFLNKTPRANWRVPWHQDATVTVRERGPATGFGAWSLKGGVQHVMAPPGILSAMLTLRLHLDACGESEGALEVIPGSHQYGRLPMESIGQFTSIGSAVCAVPEGGVLAMRPLVIHSSRPATTGEARRVIQLDFAARPLPAPLEWHEAFPVFHG